MSVAWFMLMLTLLPGKLMGDRTYLLSAKDGQMGAPPSGADSRGHLREHIKGKTEELGRNQTKAARSRSDGRRLDYIRWRCRFRD